jgi:hypothetical protein
MAIVTIQDVTQTTGFDVVNDNLLGNDSSFGYTTLRYPSDLGSPTKNHYVVFFINQQNQTQFGGGTSTVNGVLPTAVQGRIDAGTASNPDAELSTAQATTRTNGAICLYMPDTLAFDTTQNYSDISLGDSVAGAFATGAFSVVDAFRSESAKKGVSNPFTAVAAGVLDQASKSVAGGIDGGENLRKAIMQSKIGVATNPMMELIYSSPELRSYRFDFLFYPRTSKESEEVQKIVELFQFHFNGVENPNIEKTTTCVMTSINCDYAPNGWAAYEVPGSPTPSLGKTGSPVAIRLTMGFKEIEYKTKDHYKTSQYAFLGAGFFGSSASATGGGGQESLFNFMGMGEVL